MKPWNAQYTQITAAAIQVEIILKKYWVTIQKYFYQLRNSDYVELELNLTSSNIDYQRIVRQLAISFRFPPKQQNQPCHVVCLCVPVVLRYVFYIFT